MMRSLCRYLDRRTHTSFFIAILVSGFAVLQGGAASNPIREQRLVQLVRGFGGVTFPSWQVDSNGYLIKNTDGQLIKRSELNSKGLEKWGMSFSDKVGSVVFGHPGYVKPGVPLPDPKVFSQLTDEQMAVVCQHTSIRHLSIVSKRLTDKGVRELLNLTELRSLTLLCPNISNASLAVIARLPRLHELTIIDGNFTEESFPLLAGLPQLSALTLKGVPFVHTHIRELSKIPNLRFLSVEGASVSAQGFKEMCDAFPNAYFLFSSKDGSTWSSYDRQGPVTRGCAPVAQEAVAPRR